MPVIPVREELLLSPHFGRALAFALFEVEGESFNVEVHRNPVPPQQERGRGRAVIALIRGLRPEAVIVKSIGPGAFHNLRELGIRIFRSDDRLAEEAVRRLIRGELREMEEPEEKGERDHAW